MTVRVSVRVAYFLTVAITGVACSSGGAADRPSTSPPGSMIPFGTASVSTAVEALATIGVDVRTLPSDDEPTMPLSGEGSAVRFLRFQVRNMALELSTGAGISGQDLDAATVAGRGAAVTPLLVGWLRSAGTPASDLARSWMAGQDLAMPEALVFPTIALAAFLADVTRGGTTTGVSSLGVVQPAVLATASGDFCSQVSDYLSQTLLDLLNPQAQFNVPWLKSVIDQYAPLYQGNAELFQRTIGALALLAYATSIARSWSVLANPAPGQVAYSVEGQDPVEGEVQVTVETGKQVLADEVRPCASLAQIELKGAPADGASVYWDASGLGPHAKPTDVDPELDGDQANFTYETTAESQDAAQDGAPRTAEMSVLVVVDREEMRSLAAAVAAIILGPAQGGSAGAAVKALYLKMQPTLASMMLPKAVATIDVTFHTPPSPSPSEEAGALSGTWVGTWENDNGLAAGGFTLMLEQKGASVTGTGRVSGKTCVRDVTVEGTARGSAVRLFLYGERDLSIHGGVEGDSMSGTWSSIACGTTGYALTGTWQAQRAKRK